MNIEKVANWKDPAIDFPKVRTEFTEIIIKVITSRGVYYAIGEVDYDDVTEQIVVSSTDDFAQWCQNDFQQPMSDKVYWDYLDD